MKLKLLFNFLIIISLLFFISSCDEENKLISTNDVQTVQDDATSESIYDEIFNEVDNIAKTKDDEIFNGTKSANADTCKVITVEFPETGDFPIIITIDYGDNSCVGLWGRTRKGKIIVTVDGRYDAVGATRVITFDDFYLNDIKIEGIKTVTNDGTNDNGNFTFTVELVNGKIIFSNGDIITRECTRTREWTGGDDTPFYFWDDECKITGVTTGVSRNGIAFTATITNPVEVAWSCRWIKAGTILFEREGEKSITIDYGDGTCDNLATITIDGEIYDVEL